MHVLFINARYHPEGIAGPAFTTQFLAEQLAAEGDQVSVVCRTERPGVHEEHIAGVSVVRIGLDATAQTASTVLSSVLAAHRPSLIHTVFPREFPLDAVARLAKESDLPIVHTLLAYFLLCPHGSLMRQGRRCKTQCDECHAATSAQRRFARQVDAVVGISRFVLDLHLDWGLFRDAPVRRVIHDGYQAPTGHASPSARTGAPLRLGFLGRIDPPKGLELLLEVVTGDLRDRAWTLMVGGRGESAYVNMLKQRFSDPRISFLGFVQPDHLLQQIDVLVIPSLFDEPFGRVLIEAYAHGVAVIASRRGGIPELVDEGRTGLLFDPADRGSLRDAIATLMDSPRHVAEMTELAAAKADREFSPAEILRQYRSVYEALLKGELRR